MRRAVGAIAVMVAWLAWPAGAENGYRNLVNRSYDTVADGPLGGVVVDVADPARPTERASRLRQPATRGVGRRVPTWFKLLQDRRLLPANQPPPALPQTVVLRQGGRLLQPDLDRGRQAGTIGQDSNRLTFDYTVPPGDTTARAWSDSQRNQIAAFLQEIEPALLRIYGPPAFNLGVKIIHDPSLNSLNMAVYDASANQVRLELLRDVDSADPSLTPIDDYDLYVLTYAVLKAYHDDAFLYFDAWEDGLARAAQLLAISQTRPKFGFLARDFALLFTAYDVLNQPGLESPSFLGADSGSEASIMREGLGTIRAYLAQAAWLKAYAESPDLFSRFNDAYYARFATASATAGNVPQLKSLMRAVAPQVEGRTFDDWYRRQHVFDTAVLPGAKLYVFNIPQKDFITGEPTNSLPMNVYHFETSSTNQQRPLTGTVRFGYTAYDGLDLNPAVEGASGPSALEAKVGEAGNPAGIASAVPLFFNIAGDQFVQQQRIEVLVAVNGLERLVWFPNDVAVDDSQIRNHVYGLVTNGFQGSLEIAIEGQAPVTAKVIQGAFKARLPVTLAAPVKATLTWIPDTSGGSQEVVERRNLMYLGIIGEGADAETGDAVIVFETPPETFRAFKQDIPAGLSMVTVPAFAIRKTVAEILGVQVGDLLLARADGAVTSFEPYRLGSIYRLWPNTPPFRPGYAYWLQAKEAVTLDFQGVDASRDRPFRQHYPPGWQQIGNPYTDLNFLVGDLKVQAADGSAELSLSEAQTRGLLSSGIFRYNRTTSSYELVPADAILTPYEGFWINILDERGASVIYPNVIGGGRAARHRRRAAADPLHWRVGLVADAGGYRDRLASFGVAPDAADGYSLLDLERPPPFGPNLSVSFPQTAWGRRAGRYAVDLREGNGAPKAWDFDVESNLGAGEVTLSWPDLSSVPADVSLVLTDLETGTRRFLRATGSYRFELGRGGRRALRITADRSAASALAVTSLELRTGRGGGTVSYNLTAPAEVTVTLHSQSGRLVNALATRQVASRGLNDVSFRAVDGQGRPLPAGLYRLDLIAVAPDGRQVRTTRLVRVER